MKYLIIFLICFSANANYVKQSEIESGSISKVFVRSGSCGSDCIQIPSGYNKSFHVLVDIMINDATAPIYSKSEIEACIDQIDCEAKNTSKVCTDEDETVKMALDFSDIYCTKFLRFNQIPSGRKKVVIDDALKASYLAAKQTAQGIKDAKRDEVFGTILDKLEGPAALTAPDIKKLFLYMLGK